MASEKMFGLYKSLKEFKEEKEYLKNLFTKKYESFSNAKLECDLKGLHCCLVDDYCDKVEDMLDQHYVDLANCCRVPQLCEDAECFFDDNGDIREDISDEEIDDKLTCLLSSLERIIGPFKLKRLSAEECQELQDDRCCHSRHQDDRCCHGHGHHDDRCCKKVKVHRCDVCGRLCKEGDEKESSCKERSCRESSSKKIKFL